MREHAVLHALGLPDETSRGIVLEPLAGILIAHVSHLLSAFALHRLTWLIWQDWRLALAAGLLHIVSPAGLFLSAPYAESPFSLLSFGGYWLFALAQGQGQGRWQNPAYRDAAIISSGLAFGLATTFRTNGLLNGIPFAWEFLQTILRIRQRPLLTSVRKLGVVGLGGSLIAAGSAVPQYMAYMQFCSAGATAAPRPWCSAFPPSIYIFVQKHYWLGGYLQPCWSMRNNGFLQYWTLSNIPLFFLAAPMLHVLVRSAAHYLQLKTAAQRLQDKSPSSSFCSPAADPKPAGLDSLVKCAAAAQLLLTVWTFFSSHVQIITRISSGSPVWYWWLAGRLIKGRHTAAGVREKEVSDGGRFVIFIMMYAAVQGALFASFLPPA